MSHVHVGEGKRICNFVAALVHLENRFADLSFDCLTQEINFPIPPVRLPITPKMYLIRAPDSEISKSIALLVDAQVESRKSCCQFVVAQRGSSHLDSLTPQ